MNKSRRLLVALMALFQSPTLAADSILDAPSEIDDAPFSLREQRFPSIEERVKLYMSNWYVPPCEGYDDGFVKYEYQKKKDEAWPSVQVHGYKDHPLVNASEVLELESVVRPDMVFFMDDKVVTNCAIRDYDASKERDKKQLELAARVKFRANMRMYCHDVKGSFLAAWHHIQWENESDGESLPPALLQFGDNKDSHVYGAVMVPIVKKFRSSYTTPGELEKVTSPSCYSKPRDALATKHHTHRFQPIVWKLATHRHYDKLYQVYQRDTAWDKKKDMAIFRGQLTGSRDGYDKGLSDEENCIRLKRCRLVYKHGNSTYIDAKLTSTRGRLPDVLNGVDLMTKKVDLSDMMAYKGIIMIEGNDVASGLKWALLSQSVVLMPPPKHTSWAMEELLQPWVHYVPLDDFATDVEEKMRWIVNNDEKAQRIAERATLWMEDLVFHPDASEDDRLVQEEIVRRYSAHFIQAE